MNESKKQIWSVLEYLKELGVPGDVRLMYYDSSSKFICGDFFLDEFPYKELEDDFEKMRRYTVQIRIGYDEYYLENNQPHVNLIQIQQLISSIPEVYFINYNRKKILDDILNDTTRLS